MFNLDEKNPYLILNVKPGDSIEHIKHCYHCLLKENHPDVSDEDNANVITYKIISAYESIVKYEKGEIPFDNDDFVSEILRNIKKRTNEETGEKQDHLVKDRKWHGTDQQWIEMCQKWSNDYYSRAFRRRRKASIWLDLDFFDLMIEEFDEPLLILRFISKGYSHMDKSEIKLRIVGTTFENRLERIDNLKDEERVYAIREADNPYDDNAVLLVNSDGLSLGHLARRYAKVFAQLIDNGIIRIDGVYVDRSRKKAWTPDYRFVISETNK